MHVAAHSLKGRRPVYGCCNQTLSARRMMSPGSRVGGAYGPQADSCRSNFQRAVSPCGQPSVRPQAIPGPYLSQSLHFPPVHRVPVLRRGARVSCLRQLDTHPRIRHRPALSRANRLVADPPRKRPRGQDNSCGNSSAGVCGGRGAALNWNDDGMSWDRGAAGGLSSSSMTFSAILGCDLLNLYLLLKY